MLEEKKSGSFFRPERIVLTGFRATGKSAVGAGLAARLGIDFIDTDAELCTGIKCTVAEYVHRYGWPAFRQRERELLLQLAGRKKAVIATGGGAVLHRDEWDALRKNSLVVWLMADAATIRRRLQEDRATAAQRPSLTGIDCGDEVEKLLSDREMYYREGSDMRVDTCALTPDEIVQAIIKRLSAGNPK
jgi:shikimate kinase